MIEGRMEREKKRGCPRIMLQDWMMKQDYSKLKERAGDRGEWHLGHTNSGVHPRLSQ